MLVILLLTICANLPVQTVGHTQPFVLRSRTIKRTILMTSWAVRMVLMSEVTASCSLAQSRAPWSWSGAEEMCQQLIRRKCQIVKSCLSLKAC